MNSFKAVIFDYCNVLEGPSDPIAFEQVKTSLAHKFGFETGQAFWHHFYSDQTWQEVKRGKITAEAFWDNRLSSLGITEPEKQQAFIATLFQYHDIYPQMLTLVSQLKELKYRLAVVSNTDRTDLDQHIRKTKGFADSFEFVISSAVVGFAKPEPEIYVLAIDKLNLPPEEILFIDDLPRNTAAAEELGIPSIVFTSPTDLSDDLLKRGILH